MPIEVPASITSPEEILALNNELNQEAIIDESENTLTEVFSVTILSEGSNKNMATVYGAPAKERSPSESGFFFSRIRRPDIDGKQLPSPFLAKTLRAFKRLVNMHPIAILPVAMDGSRPLRGEVWEARYLSKFRKGLILIRKTSNSGTAMDELARNTGLELALFENPDGNVVGDYGASTGTPGNWGAPEKRQYVGSNSTWKGKTVENGKIPIKLLYTSNEGTVVLVDTVENWNKLEAAYFKEFNFRLGKGAGMRTYDAQVATKKRHIAKGTPNYAAKPGTSKHGWGLAVDVTVRDDTGKKVSLPSGVAKKNHPGYGFKPYKWLLANAPTYGFHNPGWARQTGSIFEPWHFEWIDEKSVLKTVSAVKSGEE